MKVGVHTSIAGGVENAAHHAHEIGCDTFQMFSANPRGWRASAPANQEVERFRAVRAAYELSPVVIHDNYLINLASADAVLRERSMQAFRGELQRGLALGAEYLVTHPGSARDSTPAEAVRRCIESIRQAALRLNLDGLTILIENTAGQGSIIGRTFEEVAEIVESAGRDVPVAACVDTAHCFAAGYSIHTEEGLRETLRQLDGSVGLERVRVIHANDSKAAYGSHVDRHEHIGKGAIGREAFRRIVTHPRLACIPFICETPVDEPGDDERNLRTMRRLAGESHRKAKRKTAGA